MGVAKITQQREVGKAPGKGLLPGVPLPCLRRVAASCGLASFVAADKTQEGSASSRVIGVSSSWLVLLIRRTQVPQGCGIDRRRLQ